MESLNELNKHMNPEVRALLKQVMQEMIKAQEAEEKENYVEFGVTPTEAVNIIEADGGPSLLQAYFGLDVARVFNARNLDLSADMRAIFMAGELIAAGIIIGKRQERTRKKVKRHDKREELRELINSLLDRMTNVDQVEHVYRLVNEVFCRPDWWYV